LVYLLNISNLKTSSVQQCIKTKTEKLHNNVSLVINFQKKRMETAQDGRLSLMWLRDTATGQA